MPTIYDYSAVLNNGKEISLNEYQGKVILVVNTASACGFTPQYKGLQELYERYNDQGFEILAFPCNQFGQQENGNDEKIKNFCTLTFNISFPLFSKIDVNGESEHPAFAYLKENARGFLGSKDIKWNFTKFLINRQGEVVKRFGSVTKPHRLEAAIKKELAL